jgi:hypothetical protein
MKITYSGGDLITNGHELLVKLNSTTLITLRALTEDLKFLAQPPMIIAHGGGVSWSLTLDNTEQLIDVCKHTNNAMPN